MRCDSAVMKLSPPGQPAKEVPLNERGTLKGFNSTALRTTHHHTLARSEHQATSSELRQVTDLTVHYKDKSWLHL